MSPSFSSWLCIPIQDVAAVILKPLGIGVNVMVQILAQFLSRDVVSLSIGIVNQLVTLDNILLDFYSMAPFGISTHQNME